MPVPRRQWEVDIVRYSGLLHSRGWVANHDGNISIKLDSNRFLITPTGTSKSDVERGNLLIVDKAGKRIGGKARSFSELNLHLYAYTVRPDIRVVMHAHPPSATGFAVAGHQIHTRMMAEPVVSLGAEIPMVPYTSPKTPESSLVLEGALSVANALLLENHGVMSVGPDLETAYLRMELVEHLAKIQVVAHQLGGVRLIPEEDVQILLESHRASGLHPSGSLGLSRAG
ncbi:MAG: class II aldolase/adducin family protein [Myxococcota bacterium]|nr:class II aldolase/adducin family protein [Myxococcota bacterium]